MKNFRKCLALISSIVFLCSAAACGETAIESSLVEESILVSADDEQSSDNSKSDSDTSDSDENNESDSDNSIAETSEKDNVPASDSSSDSQQNSDNSSAQQENQEASDDTSNDNTAEENNSENAQAANKPSGADFGKNPQTGGNTASGNTGNSGGSHNNNFQQNSSSSNNTGGSSNGNASAQQPTQAPADSSDEEVKTYAAEIKLGSTPSITGANAAADGSRVVITAGGDYLVSGSVSDGQIEVNTKEKVKLYFNGVSIHNSSGPAVQVTDAKRFIIVLMEGTTSTLTDAGTNKAYDGVIFSNDTVEIKGKGSLNITSGNRHGITSDDDVVIENGNITINSVKTGIMAHDDITVNGGTLNIKSGTNGMKSDGTMHINGGFSVICGGTKEEKSSVYTAGALTYTNGYLFAAGNAVTAPSQSVNPYVVAGFASSQAAGTSVSLSVNGSEKTSFAPHNVFKCIMMLTPEINIGGKVDIKINGISNSYSITDTSNIFTID